MNIFLKVLQGVVRPLLVRSIDGHQLVAHDANGESRGEATETCVLEDETRKRERGKLRTENDDY